MSDSRFKENREHRLGVAKPSEERPVLVSCPKCGGMASVIPFGDDEVKCTCFKCGYAAKKSANGRSFHWYDETPTDGYFGFELWLKTSCVGHSLWAFHREHLEFLQAYVGATLRERCKDDEFGWSNSSFASRLPKWLKSAKNREPILKAIDELKAKGTSVP
jgi:ribosomal protein S27AE